jgi:hypothetical protein
MVEKKAQDGYYYDSSSGKWIKSTAGNSTSKDKSDTSDEANYKNSSSESKTKDDVKKTEKKYRDIEYCTLEGDVIVLPTTTTIKIHAGDTLNLMGIGDHLSGLYYVSKVTRSISSEGYTQTMTLIKTGFGDSVKAKLVSSKTAKTTKKENRAESKELNTAEFKVGDTVKVVGASAVYSNASEGKKIPDWVKKKELTISKLSDTGDRALLKEITSWTYTKYLKSV